MLTPHYKKECHDVRVKDAVDEKDDDDYDDDD